MNNKKETVNINVETVDIWWKTVTYMSSTLSFWKLDDKWPINTCKDALDELSDAMYATIHQDEKDT